MLENEALSSHPAEGGTPAVPYYWKSVDWDGLMRDYPPPPYFQQTTGKLSEQELRALQNTRFIARMEDAWRTPFYAMRWGAAGIEPGDIRRLIKRLLRQNSNKTALWFEKLQCKSHRVFHGASNLRI